EAVGGAGRARPRAVLRHVAGTRRGATDRAGGLEAVGGTRRAGPRAALGHAARARRGATHGARGLAAVGGTRRARPPAAPRRRAGSAGREASGGQAGLGGAGAVRWLAGAVLVLGAPDVDAFEPLAPGLACNASALSEEASVVVPPELELSALNRSVMPDGAPTSLLSARPKQPTSIVLATVVVIDGAELLAAPPDALMG